MTWWRGPWDCTDCEYTAYNYTMAEAHKRRTKHGLENRNGGRMQ